MGEAMVSGVGEGMGEMRQGGDGMGGGNGEWDEERGWGRWDKGGWDGEAMVSSCHTLMLS